MKKEFAPAELQLISDPQPGPPSHHPLEFFYLLLDESGFIRQANQSAMLLLKERELNGLNFSRFVHEEDAPAFLVHLRKCRGGQTGSVRSELRVNCGRRFVRMELISTRQPFPDLSLFRTSLLRTGSDDGLRRQGLAEQIVEALDEPLVIINPQAEVVFCNPFFHSLVHERRGACEGRCLLALPSIVWLSPSISGWIEAAFAGHGIVQPVLADCYISATCEKQTLKISAQPLKTVDGAPLLLLHFQNYTVRLRDQWERQQMFSELQHLSDKLDQRVRQQTRRLHRAHEQLQHLSAKLVDTQERERRHLASELHDEVGQNLTGLKLLLGEIMLSSPTEPVAEAHRIVLTLIQQVRQLSLDLRPQIVDDLGIKGALESQVEQFARFARLEAKLTVRGPGVKELPSTLAVTLYRLVQEALTNVARHANATEVRVSLFIQKNRTQLCIADNGRGFDPALLKKKSLGMAGMKERVALLGGTFRVSSTQGRGTEIRCCIPVLRVQEVSPAESIQEQDV